jgi:glycerol uptake facilitator-like aquaporin
LSWLFQESALNVVPTENKYAFTAIVMEVLGTFLVTLFYLTQTEEKTQFSKEKAIQCFIIAASYVGARSLCAADHITSSGAVLNPAIGFGADILSIEGWKWIWIYALVPFGGSVLAILFHEFVFKKT